MIWPERLTCHDTDWQAKFAIAKNHLRWRDAVVDSRYPTLPFTPLRMCGYCGSLHPADLLTAIERGAILSGSDWKYGWPHKFYVQIPHPDRDKQAEIGGKSYWDEEKGIRIYEPIYGAMGDYYAKWYNLHLTDQGYDREALTTLLGRLADKTGIEFELHAGKLRYKAPYRGYQA